MDSFAKGTDQARYVPDLLYYPYKQLDFNYYVNDNHIDHTAKNEIDIKLIKSTINTIPKETFIGHTESRRFGYRSLL